MDQLALHIEYLLRRNDCVILPGVGAFIAVHIPARYDEETSTWHPMSQEIRFNQAVNQDDGLLANSYSRKYSLPFHEARILLDSDIRAMLNLIENDGEVSIGRIGILKQGEVGSLIFRPLCTQTYTGKEVGLIPVTSYQKQHNEVKLPLRASENIPVKSESEIREEMAGRIFDTRKNYYIAINKVFAKIASSVILFCLLASIVVLNTDLRIGEDKASVFPVEEIVDTTTSTANKAQATAMKADEGGISSEGETISTSSEHIDITAESSNKKRYHLIIGTFRTEAETVKFVKTLNIEDEVDILPSKTLWRVSLSSSDDKSELITMLRDPDVSLVYSGAWIYEDKSAN